MGCGLEYKCSCGYSFTPYLGVGFLFPQVYEKFVKMGKKGRLGTELQEFLTKHPEGVINAENVVVKCQSCGEYDCVPDLSMYLPKVNEQSKYDKLSSANYDENENYAVPWDLDERFTLYAKYPHKCKCCGGEARIISEEELNTKGIVCPRCGKAITKEESRIMWD